MAGINSIPTGYRHREQIERLPKLSDQEPSTKVRVFCSYSRKDTPSLEPILEIIENGGFELIYDQTEGAILPSENWRERISRLIERSDIFAFFLSPNSLSSSVCEWEVQVASERGKLMIPIVIDDPAGQTVPEQLQALQYLFMRTRIECERNVTRLLTTLGVDARWLRYQTDLLERALIWERRDRVDAECLAGATLEEAKEFTVRPPRGAPQIPQLLQDFVLASITNESKQQRHLIEEARKFAEIQDKRLREARATQLVLQGRLLMSERPDLALLLTEKAWSESGSDATANAMLRAITEFPHAITYLRKTIVNQPSGADHGFGFGLAFSPDGSTLVHSQPFDRRAVSVWQRGAGNDGYLTTLHILPQNSEEIIHCALSDRGRLVALTLDWTIVVWEGRLDHGREPDWSMKLSGPQNQRSGAWRKMHFAFDEGGRWLLVPMIDRLSIIDTEGRASRIFDLRTEQQMIEASFVTVNDQSIFMSHLGVDGREESNRLNRTRAENGDESKSFEERTIVGAISVEGLENLLSYKGAFLFDESSKRFFCLTKDDGQPATGFLDSQSRIQINFYGGDILKGELRNEATMRLETKFESGYPEFYLSGTARTIACLDGYEIRFLKKSGKRYAFGSHHASPHVPGLRGTHLSSPSRPGSGALAEFASIGPDGSLILWSDNTFPNLVSTVWQNDDSFGAPIGVACCEGTGDYCIWSKSAIICFNSNLQERFRASLGVHVAQFVEGQLVVITRDGYLQRLVSGSWNVLAKFDLQYCVCSSGIALIFGPEGRVWRVRMNDGSIVAKGVIESPPEKGFGWYNLICSTLDASTFAFNDQKIDRGKIRVFDARTTITELEPLQAEGSVEFLSISHEGDNLFVGEAEGFSIVSFPDRSLAHNYRRGWAAGGGRSGVFDISNQFLFEYAYSSSLNIISQENWDVVASIRMAVTSVAAQSSDGKGLFCILEDKSVVHVSLNPDRWSEISKRIAGRDWSDAEKERYLSGA